ncbi:hydroxyacid dehydrogenase [Alicyclobacillus ferrooxydans]|uniref:hydroxyacid dehydrogenase n=1 Tax=Alicyclobacillus ferrooxydans TaxID=471514 RepID=UPI0006D55A83|nr:hydroxyacid dehydrogenase [Alicyclobacillus ferrooxydans]
MKPKVVISEDLWWDVPHSFSHAYEVTYDPSLVDDPTRLHAIGKDAKALVVRNRTRVDGNLLTQFPELKVVGRLGVGLDNIDLPACQARDVRVVAARGCNAISVAEYVIACLFHHARFLHTSDIAVRGGVWNRAEATGFELFGKTLGLVGVGDIGQRVATRAKALGLHVIAYDPFVLPTSALAQDVGVELVDLETLLRQSHYVSVHVPLTPATRYILGPTQLVLMRDDAVLINTSRGGTVDEGALAEVLVRSPYRSAYLDVREAEPPDADDPLVRLPNVIVTPHVAGITKESSQRVAEFVLKQVDTVLQGFTAQGMVM